MRPAETPREVWLDLARALAILGMFIVHAVLVLGRSVPSSGALHALFWLCDGRAAATFVTLAGIGVAKLAERLPDGERGPTLRRRALALGLLGLLNLGVWEGDILRLYGVALLLAPDLLKRSTRALVAGALGLALSFPLLAWGFRWEARWDFATLTYRGLWEPVGLLRNTFLDGFRPVVPWLAFFLAGLLLARLDFGAARIRRRLALAGGGLLGGSLLLSAWAQHRLPGPDTAFLFGTGSMPPLPLFLASAAGTTALTLALALGLAERTPAWLREALSATGRRALTWYLGHIALLVGLYLGGIRHRFAPGAAMALGLAGFAAAVALSYRWRARQGLLERALRWVSRPLSPSAAR